MSEVLGRLTALCMAAALSEQLTAGSRLRDGIRLIGGLIAARLMLEIMALLPSALMG